MVKNNVWLIAIASALGGALVAGGAVWAIQNGKTTALATRVMQADAAKRTAELNLQATSQRLATLQGLQPSGSAASTGATSSSTPTPTQVPATRKAVTVKRFAFVENVSAGATKNVISADYALMLSGDAAAKAATAHGDESPPPNDYYIVNDNKHARQLRVKPGIKVTVTANDDGTSDPSGHKIEFAAWAAAYDTPTETNASLREGPYWLSVKDGVVVKIVQQYLP